MAFAYAAGPKDPYSILNNIFRTVAVLYSVRKIDP